MKNISNPLGILLGLLGCLILVAAGEAWAHGKIDKVYALGDSYTDGGESGVMSAYKITKKLFTELRQDSRPPLSKEADWLPGKPESPYVKVADGRWTNGLTAVEVLASQLKVPLRNYAVGGATTGKGNYCTWLDEEVESGLLGQVAQLKKDAESDQEINFKNTLVSIFASANDYFYAEDQNQKNHNGPIQNIDLLVELVDQAILHTETAIRQLAEIGAKKFLVVGSSDLSIVPWEVTYKRTSDAHTFTAQMNRRLNFALKRLREELKIEIVYFDHVDFSINVRKNAAQFGFMELWKPCTLSQPDPKVPGEPPICKNPDEHYFWDEYHPTRKVHELVGIEMKRILSK